MIQLAEYTTKAYDVTVTSSSYDAATFRTFTTSSYYSTIYSSTSSATYWKSQLQDSRSFSSSTSSTQYTSSTIISYSTTDSASVQTYSNSYTEVESLIGKTVEDGPHESYWSRVMSSLEFSHTGIQPYVSVTVIGNYTSRTTTHTYKAYSITVMTSTIEKTWAKNMFGNEVDSAVVQESLTHYWSKSTSSYSTTSDYEHLISKGVKSSLMASYGTSSIMEAEGIYNYETSSSARLIATQLSGTVYDSTVSRAWTSSASTESLYTANSMTFVKVDVSTLTNFNKKLGIYFTSLATYSKYTTVYSSSANFLTITVFPQYNTYDVSTETAYQTFEDVSATNEHTASTTLYSLTMVVQSQVSGTTSETSTFSSSYYDELSYSNSWSTSSKIQMGYVESRSLTRTSSTYIDVVTSLTKTSWYYVAYYYSYYTGIITASSYSNTHYRTSYTSYYETGSTWYSSTTYTGIFGDIRISTYETATTSSNSYDTPLEILLTGESTSEATTITSEYNRTSANTTVTYRTGEWSHTGYSSVSSNSEEYETYVSRVETFYTQRMTGVFMSDSGSATTEISSNSNWYTGLFSYSYTGGTWETLTTTYTESSDLIFYTTISNYESITSTATATSTSSKASYGGNNQWTIGNYTESTWYRSSTGI